MLRLRDERRYTRNLALTSRPHCGYIYRRDTRSLPRMRKRRPCAPGRGRKRSTNTRNKFVGSALAGGGVRKTVRSADPTCTWSDSSNLRAGDVFTWLSFASLCIENWGQISSSVLFPDISALRSVAFAFQQREHSLQSHRIKLPHERPTCTPAGSGAFRSEFHGLAKDRRLPATGRRGEQPADSGG